MRRSGISTALGTVLFIVIASIFLAFMYRMYSTLTVSMLEIASQKVEQLAEGVPLIRLNYSEAVSVTPSVGVLASGGYSWSGGILNVKCLNLSAQPPPPGVVFPFTRNSCVALVRISVSRGTFGSLGNFSLSLSGDAFVEVYEPRGSGAWIMTGRYFLNGSSARFSFKNESLLYAYNPNSSRSFNLNIYDLKGYKLELLSPGEVLVSNEGYLPLEVFAVYVSGPTGSLSSVKEHVVLFPGETRAFKLNTDLTPGYEYEVRVVTKLRTYTAVFRVGG